MHAQSHIPTCDAIPRKGRRRARSVVPFALAAMLLPVPAMAQEVRARDLSIVEDVLVESIQDAIQTSVRSVNTENIEAQETARQDAQPVPVRYVFRSTGNTQARGMFLEDYGAIFTVQVPSMSYSYSGFYQMARPESVMGNELGEEMQMRIQMNRMEAEIDSFKQRLEAEVERNGEDSEAARMLRDSLTNYQSAFDETQRAYSEYQARLEAAAVDERRRGVSGSELTPEARPARPDRMAVLRASAEEIAAAEELAIEQRNQVEGAIIDAVIESLAQYGRIMHGLDDDDRLAVVLLPSSYLNPIGSWARATERDEEFIISVRFGDVLDYDSGDLDDEEFRSRVSIQYRQGESRQR